MNKERLHDLLPELDDEAALNFYKLMVLDEQIKGFYNSFCDRDLKLSNAIDDLLEVICENIKNGSLYRQSKFYQNVGSISPLRKAELDNGGVV